MGEAILVGGRMGDVEQKIYKWKQYQANATNTYIWNRYNAVESVTYRWTKYKASYSYKRVTTNQSTCWLYPGSPVFIVTKGSAYAPQEFLDTSDYKYRRATKLVEGAGNEGKFVTIDVYASSYSDTIGCQILSNSLPTLSSSSRTGIYYGSHKIGTSCFYLSEYNEWVVDLNNDYYGGTERTDTTVAKGDPTYESVESSVGSAYPASGALREFWYESNGSTSTWSKGSTSYPDVSSTDRTAYPDNDHSGEYWYAFSHFTTEYSMGEYVSDRISTDRNRFPDNGYSDGFYYVFDGEA